MSLINILNKVGDDKEHLVLFFFFIIERKEELISDIEMG